MKLCLIVMIYLNSFLLLAQTHEVPHARVKALVRIVPDAHGIKVWSKDKTESIPTILGNDEVRKLVHSLQAETEAMIEGYTSYEITATDSTKKLKPYFIIESIRPISLSELGLKSSFKPELTFNLNPKPEHYVPVSIPITTEVASAMTMTTSLLLMESLTTSPNEPGPRHELRQSLFISAGLMATFLFIYDQMEGKSKP